MVTDDVREAAWQALQELAGNNIEDAAEVALGAFQFVAAIMLLVGKDWGEVVGVLEGTFKATQAVAGMGEA